MNKERLAHELVRIAREVMALDQFHDIGKGFSDLGKTFRNPGSTPNFNKTVSKGLDSLSKSFRKLPKESKEDDLSGMSDEELANEVAHVASDLLAFQEGSFRTASDESFITKTYSVKDGEVSVCLEASPKSVDEKNGFMDCCLSTSSELRQSCKKFGYDCDTGSVPKNPSGDSYCLVFKPSDKADEDAFVNSLASDFGFKAAPGK